MRKRRSSRGAVLAHLMFLPEVLASWCFQFDSPVSSVLLFPLRCQTGASRDKGVLLLWFHPRVWWWCVCSWLEVNGRHHSSIVPLSVESSNLLVTSTIEMAVVYRSEPLKCLQESPPRADSVCLFRDVQQSGLSRPVFLSESDQWDAVVCALVIDLDFDGQKEVLLGTYGQVMHRHPSSIC